MFFVVGEASNTGICNRASQEGVMIRPFHGASAYFVHGCFLGGEAAQPAILDPLANVQMPRHGSYANSVSCLSHPTTMYHKIIESICLVHVDLKES